MEPVHRDDDALLAERRRERSRHRGLARTGRTGDAENHSVPAAEQGA
ncbi:hypothetical protein [Salana multivorans]